MNRKDAEAPRRTEFEPVENTERTGRRAWHRLPLSRCARVRQGDLVNRSGGRSQKRELARSTLSCGSACEGDQTCEAARSRRTDRRGEEGEPPRTAKTRALTQVNPIRPRYTKLWAANLPEMPKPATDRMDNERRGLVGPTGVTGEGACREVDQGPWEIRRGVGVHTTRQHGREIHNSSEAAAGSRTGS